MSVAYHRNSPTMADYYPASSVLDGRSLMETMPTTDTSAVDSLALPPERDLFNTRSLGSSKSRTRDILIVDNLPESLDLLSRILSNQDFNVRVAPTGQLALRSIRIDPPTLILLDVGLPDIDGFEICQQLNADPLTRHIPIIFLSSQDDVQAKAKAFQTGAVDFITKPFEAVELLARINNHIRLQDLWHRLHKRNQHQQRLLNEHRTLKQLLFQEKELAEVTLQSIGDAVVTTDAAGKIQSLNPVAEKLLRLSRSRAEGREIQDVFRLYNELTGAVVNHPVLVALRAGEVVSPDEQSILVNIEGEEFPISESVAPIRDRAGNVIGAIMVFRDVTESRQMARRLSWQATHDPLTNLYNRSEFERQLLLVVERVRLQEQQAALCYMDLDRFKIVNDTCGHEAGDELLRQVTLTVQQRISSQDIFARVGGDEFALILLNRSPEEAEALAEKICRVVQEFRFAWQAHTFKIGASIGLVHLDEDYRDTSEILSSADAACYFSKEQGRNQVQVYRGDDQAIAQRRDESQWINRLNLALEEARFCLYGQAIIPLRSDSNEQTDAQLRAASHHEVLLRMIDEDGEIVPPMSFIPVAERYDLMPEIDFWVVENFLRYFAQNRRQNSPGRYTINLSGASINKPKFVDGLETLLSRSSVPSEVICFEITETAAIANLTSAAKSIRQLKQLGCQFALDDFGSGMSSLAYLKHLPVDYLKIDGSFVRNIDHDPVNRAMVESCNHIAHVMGLKTIAEYAESPQILQVLQEIGVDYAQGNAVAEPHLLFIDELC